MRDLFNDLEASSYLSDPDPVRRAQIQMRQPQPKRFYSGIRIVETLQGHAVYLDDKPVRTPAKTLLALPSRQAADLVAAEFEAQQDTIDIASMPVFRLVNTAIDGTSGDMRAVQEDIVRFSSSDLLCYRAEGPEKLAMRQAAAWDPVLDWAQGMFGVRFCLAQGVMHVEQPRETINAIDVWLRRNEEPFQLSALHLMTTLTGSALLALALECSFLEPDIAWNAAHVDEDWTIEYWGEDDEASAHRRLRRRDFDAAIALSRAVAGPQ